MLYAGHHVRYCIDFDLQQLQSVERNGRVDKCYNSLRHEVLKDRWRRVWGGDWLYLEKLGKAS